MSRKKHDFVIWQSEDRKRYWWSYYDGNYECICNSETYPTLDIAQKSLANFKYEMKSYLGL